MKFDKKFLSDNAMWLVLIALLVLFGFGNKSFLTITNMDTLLRTESAKGIMTFGVMMAILSKGTDLSTGSVVALSSVIGASLCQTGSSKLLTNMGTMPAIVGILVCLLIGAAIGACNGAMVAYLHLHPFIATLGTQLICRALAKMYSPRPISSLSDGFRFLGKGDTIIAVFLVFLAISAFMLRYTRFGKSVYAVGGNDQAARVAGINVEWVQLRVYIWCSFCAAVAGVLLAGKTNSADPVTTGLNYELDAIAAATVGGTSQTGGICRISGAVAGILIMGVITNGLTLMGVTDNMTYVIKGLIIIVSVAVDMRKNAVKK